jgi:hypothetical protein
MNQTKTTITAIEESAEPGQGKHQVQLVRKGSLHYVDVK